MRTLVRRLFKRLKKLRRVSLRRWRGRLLNCRAAIRRLTLRRTTFIGVTGSCGKSTTITLTEAVLSSVGPCWTGMGSNRWLAAETILGAAASTKFCLVELHASWPGLIGESLSFLRPQIGLVTTVGGDHYKSYRGPDATACEKGLLVGRLPQSGVAILNIDSPPVRDMAERTRARLMTFGLSPQADLRALEVSGAWPNRLSMKVAHGHETVDVETRLVGEHWATSVLGAIALGVVCGVDLKACAQAVKTVEPVFGRYSVHIRSDGGSYVLDSYKAPYWTIVEGLAFVRSAAAPRKTIVFGTISDYPGARGSRYRRVARDALNVADRVLFVGPNSGHIDKLRRGEARDRLCGFQTSYEASAFVNGNAIPGELIYVKAGITDHLERIMLSQLGEVVCWRERCGRWAPCMQCRDYHNAAAPPFIGAAAELALATSSEPAH